MSFSAAEQIDQEFEVVEEVRERPVYQLVRIGAEHFVRLMPVLGEMMETVYERAGGEMDGHSVARSLADNTLQFWAVTDGDIVAAVVGTSIEVAATGKRICQINFCAGHHRSDWLHLLEQIEQWAVFEEGCHGMKVIARKGWAKSLPEYRMTHIVLEKDLGRGI